MRIRAYSQKDREEELEDEDVDGGPDERDEVEDERTARRGHALVAS